MILDLSIFILHRRTLFVIFLSFIIASSKTKQNKTYQSKNETKRNETKQDNLKHINKTKLDMKTQYSTKQNSLTRTCLPSQQMLVLRIPLRTLGPWTSQHSP